MYGGKGRKGRGLRASAVAAVAFVASVAHAADDARNVRLVNVVERWVFASAFNNAVRRLGQPRCQALLDEFADAGGRPLRTTLEASGLTAIEYPGTILFYDAPSRLCGTSALALTTPGSRIVFVCSARFAREMSRNSRHAEATIIHETLHSLGLGENPPSSDHITKRVLTHCAEW